MNKTIIATAIAALLATSALPVIAQDAAVGVDAGVKVETPAVAAQVGAGADASASVAENTYTSVTSSVATSAAVDLSAITDESKVSIVLVSSLQGDAATEAAALDEALTANADAMTTLHASIDGNAVIKAKLEAEGHASSDVIAVTSNADGSVIVYVDDRA